MTTTRSIRAAISRESQHSARTLPTPSERQIIRESAGLSRPQLAAILKVSRTTIRYWETGERTPHGLHLRRYQEALDAMRQAAAA